jgi:hypothetical protein
VKRLKQSIFLAFHQFKKSPRLSNLVTLAPYDQHRSSNLVGPDLGDLTHSKTGLNQTGAGFLTKLQSFPRHQAGIQQASNRVSNA